MDMLIQVLKKHLSLGLIKKVSSGSVLTSFQLRLMLQLTLLPPANAVPLDCMRLLRTCLGITSLRHAFCCWKQIFVLFIMMQTFVIRFTMQPFMSVFVSVQTQAWQWSFITVS